MYGSLYSAADAIFSSGDFQLPEWASFVPAGIEGGALQASVTAYAPGAAEKPNPVVLSFPCDSVFSGNKDETPMSHTQAAAMLDRVDATGRTAISAVILAATLQGARDVAERQDAERRRMRYTWQV